MARRRKVDPEALKPNAAVDAFIEAIYAAEPAERPRAIAELLQELQRMDWLQFQATLWILEPQAVVILPEELL